MLRVESTYTGKGGRFQGSQHCLNLLAFCVLAFYLYDVQLIAGGLVNTHLGTWDKRTLKGWKIIDASNPRFISTFKTSKYFRHRR